MQESCEQFERLLVDYADGELSPPESPMVAEHLTKCERCRATLHALTESLSLTGAIWQDGLARTQDIHPAIPTKVHRVKWARYAAIAAGIVIVGGLLAIWNASTRPREAGPTLAEMERRITECDRAARLLAAAELLADHPDAESISKRQYRYIVETYPQTPAAAKAKPKIQ